MCSKKGEAKGRQNRTEEGGGNEGPGRRRKRGGREGGGEGAANTTHMHGGKWEGRFVTLVLVRSEASGGCVGLPPPPFFSSAAGKATTTARAKGEGGGEPPLESPKVLAQQRGGAFSSFFLSPLCAHLCLEAGSRQQKGAGEERRGPPQLERRASSGRETPFSSACQHPHLKEGRRKTLLDFPPFPLAYAKTVQKHRL